MPGTNQLKTKTLGTKLLAAARLRLRTRQKEKFPNVFESKTSSQIKTSTSTSTTIDQTTRCLQLDAARLRIRERFQTKYPVVWAAGASNTTAETLSGRYANSNDPEKSSITYLEEARKRIRSRFLEKFGGVFQGFPTTIDDALYASGSDWGTSKAVVITSPTAPHHIIHVNQCWENLCGYKQEETIGKTFQTLGLQRSTDAQNLRRLSELLGKGQQAEMYLTNLDRDGREFQNYLRVTPLYDENKSSIVAYLGVLEEVGIGTRKTIMA